MPIALALLVLLGVSAGGDACARIVQEAETRGIRCTCTFRKESSSYRLSLTEASTAGLQATLREKITPLLEIVGRIDEGVTGEVNTAWVETTGFTARARLPRDCARVAPPGSPEYETCLRPAIRVQGKPVLPPQVPESGPAPEPLRITPGMDITPPKLIHRTEPVYPEAAKKAGVQGEVLLECTVTGAGDVRVSRVLHSIPELDEAAIAAVKQWKYKPALRRDEPVPVYLIVRLSFALASGEPGE